MNDRFHITTAEWPTVPARPGALETLRVDGRSIAYQDVGTGPTIILAHCSSGSHREWAPLVARLSGRYRILAPDLLGYGRSEAWPVNASLPATADVNVLLALADLAGEPVHLVGWWAMSGDAKRRVIKTVGKVGAEFEAVQRLSRTLADYRNIFAPTRLIAGERTRHAARLIVNELLTLLPAAQLSVVARAAHMSPVTHPDAIVALIENHVDTHQGAPKPALTADATRPALSYTAGPLRPTRFEHAG